MYPLSKSMLPCYLLFALILSVTKAAAAAPLTPERPVVSGSLASDEVLAALFADDKDPPVVLSAFADDPAHSSITTEAKRFPKRWHNSAEALLALRPALVILASWNNPALKARIKQAKVPIIELQSFDSIDDIKANIRIVGAAVQRLAQAEALIQGMERTLSELARGASPKDKQPSILTYSASAAPGGSGTMIDAVIQAAGATNAAAAAGLKGWTKMNPEVLASLQPDYVLILTDPTNKLDAVKAVKADPLWQHMRAVKHDAFVFAAQAPMYSVSHHVATAAKSIHAAIYPKTTRAGGK